MSREIKFRFWDKKSKEFWDEPRDLLHFVFSYGHNYSDAGVDEDRIIFAGQFTGLKDKNGKEIYEGDIVRMLHKDIYGIVDKIFEVKFLEDWQGWNFPKDNAHTISKTFEVIGNIYENPELLK